MPMLRAACPAGARWAKLPPGTVNDTTITAVVPAGARTGLQRSQPLQPTGGERSVDEKAILLLRLWVVAIGGWEQAVDCLVLRRDQVLELCGETAQQLTLLWLELDRIAPVRQWLDAVSH